MANYNLHKVTAVPTTYSANDVYFVAPVGRPEALEIYVANAAGDALRRQITEADVALLISNSISAAGSTSLVDDIAARDLLPISGEVIVVDASADPTVDSGGAKYHANTAGDAWIKLSETESMDVTMTWESLSGGPASTPTQIDAAVLAAHVHANKTQLDLIGQDANGNMTYNGNLPSSGWTTEAW